MNAIHRILLAMFLVLPLLSACAGSIAIPSRSIETAPVIDGDPGDWKGCITPVEDAPFSLGIQHDGDFLYLAIASVDRNFTQQLLRTGLILWFDTDGGKDKTSGLRFPRGMKDLGSVPRSARGRAPAEIPPGEVADFMEDQLESQETTLSFMGREESSWSMDVDALQGMALAASARNGRFFYEASIPLSKGPERSYSLGLKPGAKLALCIEVPQLEWPERGEGRPSGMGRGGGKDGGMGGGRGGGMGRGGGRPSGGRPGGMGGPPEGISRPEAIEHWFSIELN